MTVGSNKLIQIEHPAAGSRPGQCTCSQVGLGRVLVGGIFRNPSEAPWSAATSLAPDQTIRVALVEATALRRFIPAHAAPELGVKGAEGERELGEAQFERPFTPKRGCGTHTRVGTNLIFSKLSNTAVYLFRINERQAHPSGARPRASDP